MFTPISCDQIVSRKDSMKRVKNQKEPEVILPVWHNVSREAVRIFSPTLADKIAAGSLGGLPMTSLWGFSRGGTMVRALARAED